MIGTNENTGLLDNQRGYLETIKDTCEAVKDAYVANPMYFLSHVCYITSATSLIVAGHFSKICWTDYKQCPEFYQSLSAGLVLCVAGLGTSSAATQIDNHRIAHSLNNQ